jgi:hypothetical protein
MAIQSEHVKFDSPEELLEICLMIRARLHSLNRIAMGESNLTFEIAEVFGRLGRLFAEADHALRTEFGDGYTPGTLSTDEQRTRLAELLLPAPRVG